MNWCIDRIGIVDLVDAIPSFGFWMGVFTVVVDVVIESRRR
jgi:hypothetical protein